MGKVFIEEAMLATGIDRSELVIVCTYLVRTKQASSAVDAIRFNFASGNIDAGTIKMYGIK